MKKKLALALVATVAMGVFAGCAAPTDDNTPGDTTGTFTDGNYEGVGKGYGGEIRVSVDVEDGRISNIEILEQQETTGLGDAATDTIAERIIEEQSIEVEVVTGATASSMGTMEAVKNALEGN